MFKAVITDEYAVFVDVPFKNREHAESFCKGFNNTMKSFDESRGTAVEEGSLGEHKGISENHKFRGAMFVQKIYDFCAIHHIKFSKRIVASTILKH